MIKKLEIKNILNGDYTLSPPTRIELADKINEIIDHLNGELPEYHKRKWNIPELKKLAQKVKKDTDEQIKNSV